MANAEHLDLLRQGAKVWNEWRKANPHLQPDLSDADLTGFDFTDMRLEKAKFVKATLARSRFAGANLFQAEMVSADLSDADLRGGSFHHTDFCQAKLPRVEASGVGFFAAFLWWTDLSGAELTKADFMRANLNGAELVGANLTGANLSFASFVETNVQDSILSESKIFGLSAWGVRGVPLHQANLLITGEHSEPRITCDDLEVAQFLYLLLHNHKLRRAIDTITSKVVLILGRFSEGRKPVLDAIRSELRRHDFVPILFDFEKPHNRDLTETVSTLARLARFVVADVTAPRSIPQELQAIIPDVAVPIQPLLVEGSDGEYGMFNDFRKYHWVLPVQRYRDVADLTTNLGSKVIAPAEAKAAELARR